MNIIEIIEKKKRGFKLEQEEIQFFVDGYVGGDVTDYQASALLMAICINGMDFEETFNLTMAMRNSGDIVEIPGYDRVLLDKHSTGGVGDKSTLVLAPILAAMDIPVFKMSGRGLGITGGTIDKLEAVPGFSSLLTTEQMVDIIQRVGCLDAAQTANLVPADKKLYALRDVTGTVDSIPLIASSIMSKKLALGTKGIVLDVKCGSGAFMKSADTAKDLATTMIEISKRAGRKCIAVLSDMNQPLGYTVGNKLEVDEAVMFLKEGLCEPLFKELIYVLCYQMYLISDRNDGLDYDNFTKRIDEVLQSKKSYEKLLQMFEAQGADLEKVRARYDSYGNSFESDAEYKRKVITGDILKDTGTLDSAFTITKLDAETIGKVSLALGAGRLKKEDDIDLDAGIVFEKKLGDIVKPDDVIATLYSNDSGKLDSAYEIITGSDCICLSGVDKQSIEVKNDIILDVLS